jgi:xylulokinase
MGECFIGIDSGTQSTKAVVIDGGQGRVLGSASVPHAMASGGGNGVQEQHPEMWWKALEKAVTGALRQARMGKAGIKAIGVSAQQHGFVALDEAGEVIRPAKLWCDTSTAEDAELLIRKVGGLEAMIGLTGNGLPAGFTASKILWMKRHEPKNYRRLHRVLLPHDYLNYRLTGLATMEPGDASGTGLMDTRTRNWSMAVVRQIGPELMEKLPAIQTSSAPAGELMPEVAFKLGLEPGTMVSSGGGDNMMGAIGTGNTRMGVVTASLGTSGTIYAYSPRPVVDPQGEIAAFCDSTGAWLPLLCTMNVTVATELARHAFHWTLEKMTEEAGKVPPGSDGLLLLPYFQGERVPNFPEGRAVYFGLNTTNYTGGHLCRAAMEGVAFGLNYGLRRMKDLGIRPKEIRLTGGASQNAFWRQILADVFETEVVALATHEGAALGAALQALWCHSQYAGDKRRIQEITDRMVKTDGKTRAGPDRERAKRYRQMQERHTELSRCCAPMFSGWNRTV